jgi:hypothetical protein
LGKLSFGFRQKKMISGECFRNVTPSAMIVEARDNPLQFHAKSFIHGEEASSGTPPKFPDSAMWQQHDQ